MSREILSPPIGRVGNRRYRLNAFQENRAPGDTYMRYREEDLYDEDDEDEFEVELQGDGFFKTTVFVPRPFFGRLIGQKGMTRKRIETETKTQIRVPSMQDTSNSLVEIKGRSRKDVCRARKQVDLLVDSLRSSASATHFASVRYPESLGTIYYDQFKKSILSESHPGIDEDLFTKPEKLHITLAVCTLLYDEERAKAKEIFDEFKEYVAKQPPIEVTIRGLSIMNDDPSSVKVLYANVNSPGLQVIANEILGKFKAARLNTEKRGDSAKLHFTLMKSPWGLKKKFDCREVLKKYADHDFGTFCVKEIYLSQIHTTDTDGYYVSTDKFAI